jgi:hypothetical protein
MSDPHEELRALRSRLAQLEIRAALGRDLTPGSGPDGSLTRADLAAMTPDEINARWSEVGVALGGGSTTTLQSTADLADLTPDEINARWDEVAAILAKPKGESGV